MGTDEHKNIVIIAGVGHGRILSVAKLVANETEAQISVFAPEPIKITSHNVIKENILLQKQFYENQPSKYISKPKNNFKKR